MDQIKIANASLETDQEYLDRAKSLLVKMVTSLLKDRPRDPVKTINLTSISLGTIYLFLSDDEIDITRSGSESPFT